MEDIPQPSDKPYSTGDRVRVYIDKDDVDVDYHDTQCIVVDRFEDDLSEETGRQLDCYSYCVRPVDRDNPLSVGFRHFDLVPYE